MKKIIEFPLFSFFSFLVGYVLYRLIIMFVVSSRVMGPGDFSTLVIIINGFFSLWAGLTLMATLYILSKKPDGPMPQLLGLVFTLFWIWDIWF